MPTYKNEATGSWYCAFYYTDWLGNRKKKKKEGFKTQREAKTFERQFIEKAEASPDMSFGTLVSIPPSYHEALTIPAGRVAVAAPTGGARSPGSWGRRRYPASGPWARRPNTT